MWKSEKLHFLCITVAHFSCPVWHWSLQAGPDGLHGPIVPACVSKDLRQWMFQLSEEIWQPHRSLGTGMLCAVSPLPSSSTLGAIRTTYPDHVVVLVPQETPVVLLHFCHYGFVPVFVFKLWTTNRCAFLMEESTPFDGREQTFWWHETRRRWPQLHVARPLRPSVHQRHWHLTIPNSGISRSAQDSCNMKDCSSQQ